MERAEIFDSLKAIIEDGLENGKEVAAKAAEASDLRTDLGLNSIGMLYLVISIEETMNVSFDDISFNDFETVKDVIDYIENKRA